MSANEPRSPEQPKVLRLPALMARVGLRRSAIYAMIQRDEFPKPIKLSPRAVGWLTAEVDAWLASRERATGEAAA